MCMTHWATNIEALRAKDPDLASRLENTSTSTSFVVFQSRMGLPTVRVRFENREILLHSAYDPAIEARRWVEGVGDIKPSDDLAVLGIGLGHHVLELHKKLASERALFIVEANPELARLALEVTNLSSLLSDPRVHFFVGSDPLEFAEWLKLILCEHIAADIRILSHPPSLQMHWEFYNQTIEVIQRAVCAQLVDFITLVDHGRKFQKNALQNFMTAVKSADVGQLFDKFPGKPGIVVAAGPSLSKNIDLLKEVKGRAVIVAVGAALKPLLARGIKPDIACTIDPMALNIRYFEGLEGLQDIALLCDFEASPLVVGSYPGKKFFSCPQIPIVQWFQEMLGFRGELHKSGSVGHTAFYLVRAMGCDPIILVGLDLSFPGMKAHADGVVEIWSLGNKKPDDPSLVWIPAIDGGMVPTELGFQSFLTEFEMQFAKTKARVIDCTEGGALKKGTEVMPLRRAIDEFCREPVNVKDVLDAVSVGTAADKALLIQRFSEAVDSMARTANIARKGLYAVAEVREAARQRDNVRIAKAKQKTMSLRAEVLKEVWAVGILERSLAKTFSDILQVKKDIRDKKLDGWERFDRELSMMEYFFRGYQECSTELKDEMLKVIQQLKNLKVLPDSNS